GLAQKSQKSGRIYDRFRSQIIFPLADARGRVRGFAGRTMGGPDDRRPKYVNSPESDLFHKRSQLFAADLARAPAAKAGSVVAAEGYTDVIAMHQAGVRNSVAIMGTALTEEQVGELARLAPVVALALDADSAGQQAMLRAAGLAARRKVELRVVELPPGEDPADLVKRAGGGEIERRVAASVPFVRFRVLRALESGNLRDAEGKDRVLADLRGVFATLAPSALREELLRIVADRMDLSQELLSSLLAGVAVARGGDSASAAGQSAQSIGRRERTERTFLAFCIARPELGGPALANLDLEHDFTVATTRRAATHLRAHLTAPTQGIPDDDDELAALMRELTVRAARMASAPPIAFEIERLQLALARLDRDITVARRSGGEVAELATRRAATQSQIDQALDRAMRDDGR
ncbi:MAG: toprim domain-containing protein, partial [Actinobacteria bacterium]|nr:toprim domain-containing protein [Actinomycetota bacterium]